MRDFLPLALLAVGFILLCGVLAYGCAQLPNEDTGERYLHNLGYENVQYVSRKPFAQLYGCAQDDMAVLKYTARNPRDRQVTVEVCQGWPFGGAHLRGQ
jgi:hypothetical protein